MKKFAIASLAMLLLTGCGAATKHSDSIPASTQTATAEKKADVQKYAVTVDETKVATDYKGNPAVVISYTFTNNDEKPASFMIATSEKLFQDGVELERAILSDHSVDSGAAVKDIKKGASVKVQSAFVLTSKSEVELTVTPLFGETPIVSTKIKVA